MKDNATPDTALWLGGIECFLRSLVFLILSIYTFRVYKAGIS